jgi:hypothetical protein
MRDLPKDFNLSLDLPQTNRHKSGCVVTERWLQKAGVFGVGWETVV